MYKSITNRSLFIAQKDFKVKSEKKHNYSLVLMFIMASAVQHSRSRFISKILYISFFVTKHQIIL